MKKKTKKLTIEDGNDFLKKDCERLNRKRMLEALEMHRFITKLFESDLKIKVK